MSRVGTQDAYGEGESRASSRWTGHDERGFAALDDFREWWTGFFEVGNPACLRGRVVLRAGECCVSFRAGPTGRLRRGGEADPGFPLRSAQGPPWAIFASSLREGRRSTGCGLTQGFPFALLRVVLGYCPVVPPGRLRIEARKRTGSIDKMHSCDCPASRPRAKSADASILVCSTIILIQRQGKTWRRLPLRPPKYLRNCLAFM